MPRILIVFTSRHDHTATIAERIADDLRRAGAEVVLARPGDAERLDLQDFEAVIAGGAVHLERHDRDLVEWARRHAVSLNRMRTGFFSVSLTVVGDPAAAREFAERFEEDTDWTPGRTALFAGALQYREYGFPTRQMLRHIAVVKGLPTDTSRDHELTDWDEVDRFAERFVPALVTA